uniref:hypothetical protein n=1 Tax=Salinibacter pepae TaxID=3040382 RepID=UPI0021E80F93
MTCTDIAETVPTEEELAERLFTIAENRPDGTAEAAWIKMCLVLGRRVGARGRLYKKAVTLSSAAETIEWKEENSVPAVLGFETSYDRNKGQVQRAKTHVRVGEVEIDAVDLCEGLGIDYSSAAEAAAGAETRRELTDALVEAEASARAAGGGGGKRGEGSGGGRDRSGIMDRCCLGSSRFLQGSRGIQGVGVVDSNDTRSCKCRLPNSLAESKTLSLLEAKMCYHDTPACKKMDMPGSEGAGNVSIPVLVRRALARRTCEYATRQMIYQYVPEAEEDPVLFRWCVYALWTTWTDQTTHRRVIHHKILHWIGHYRFQSGKGVLQYVKDRLPSTEHSNTWVVGQHTRQIIRDGLPEELWKAVDEDLSTPPGQYQD